MIKPILQVNEIFPSIQGEGLHMGRLASFIRLAGCNLECPRCDTKYSWKESKTRIIGDIVKECDFPLVVITGGEPMIQNIDPLIRRLVEANHEVHVETNGTIYKFYPLVRHFTISPKLPSMVRHGINKDILTLFMENYRDKEFKFVVGTNNDYLVMRELVQELGLEPVTIQPLDNDMEIARQIVQFMIYHEDFKFRLLPQYHKCLWGNKRGV